MGPPGRSSEQRAPAIPGVWARGLLVFVVACGSPLEGTQPNWQAPAAPGPVPANASRITANVAERKVWPPGSLDETLPRVEPGQTLYSFKLKILTAEAGSPDLAHLAVPGTDVEAFSAEELDADLIGATITATLVLVGSTRGTRWEISVVGVIDRDTVTSPLDTAAVFVNADPLQRRVKVWNYTGDPIIVPR